MSSLGIGILAECVMRIWAKATGVVLIAAIFGIVAMPGNVTALGAETNSAHKPVCIKAYNIDHTLIPDRQTIIFHMRDGKVWKNALTAPCFGLKINTSGFSYSPTNPGTDEICSNLQTIHINDTGEVCLLGEFTPYVVKGAAAAK